MGGILGGGGGSGGGTVVGGPSPYGAGLAGQYQSQAALAAAQAATSQTNMAINALRDQYTNAFTDLKPYTQTGIQALDQLNQYMGLNAYDPGTGPTAPVAPTLQSLAQQVSPDQVQAYIQSRISPIGNDQTYGFGQYSGVGQLNNADAYSNVSELTPSTPGMYGNANDIARYLGVNSGPNGTYDPSNAVAMMYAQQQMPQAQQAYQSQLDSYNQQNDMYNYAKNLQSQYNTQGPLTPDQVSAKLAATPGYQFQFGQGMDAIQRAASSHGMLGSGRLLQSLVDYGQGMASQTYGDTLSRLASLAGAGQSAASSQAQGSQNLGNNIGSLQSNLGDTIANSYLASGNAQAQAALAANQQYKVIGGGSSGAGGFGSLLGGLGSVASSLSGLFG